MEEVEVFICNIVFLGVLRICILDLCGVGVWRIVFLVWLIYFVGVMGYVIICEEILIEVFVDMDVFIVFDDSLFIVFLFCNFCNMEVFFIVNVFNLFLMLKLIFFNLFNLLKYI